LQPRSEDGGALSDRQSAGFPGHRLPGGQRLRFHATHGDRDPRGRCDPIAGDAGRCAKRRRRRDGADIRSQCRDPFDALRQAGANGAGRSPGRCSIATSQQDGSSMSSWNLRIGFLAMCVLGLGSLAPARAQVIQQYTYKTNGVYEVHAGLGITTQIVLSPYEKILDYSTGFSNGWDISRRGNVFYLRPRNVDVDTDMIVRTETHSYIFELRVVATDWKTLGQAKGEGVQYKITFDYPADTSFTGEKKSASATPALDASLVPGRAYNFHYDYAASKKTASW